MTRHITIRTIRKTFRRFFTRESAFVAVSVLIIGGVAGYGIMRSYTMINPAAYTPLLNVIADGESRGNYNAYFGNAANQEITFTNMSIADVLNWQTDYVRQGSASNAVGRYQIIQPTLQGLVDELDLAPETVFSEPLQDKLAITLLERRGSIEFIKGSVSTEEFAHNLSKEWAALPQVVGENPDDSYYAGDGLNKAQINKAEVLEAVDAFKQQAINKKD